MLLSCAEEVGLCGAKNFDTSLLKAKTGYVLDSSGPIGTIIVQAPYEYDLKVTVKGRAAHAGMEPEKGLNAIVVLAGIIAKLPNGRLDSETTINVGIISGGQATNIVTPEAQCTLEMRSIDINKIKALEKNVRVIARDVCASFGAKLRVEKTIQYHGFILKENERVIKTAGRAMRSVNIKPVLALSGGGSDTNIFNKSNIRAANLSCGMRNIHTTSEFIKIDDLIKGADLVLALISPL
jgi:tripeptide aminopeptidase